METTGRPLSRDEHHAVMLHMMVAFDEYCRQHDLRYFLAYGTLLGAARHRGFIPWDDDADLFMPRPDYERLLSADRIAEDIEVVSYRNPHGYYHPFVHTNIVDAHTIMRESHVKKQTEKGCFLDVFPLDGVPISGIGGGWSLPNWLRLRVMEYLHSCAIATEPGFASPKAAVRSLLSRLCARKDPVRMAARIDSLARKYRYEDSEFVTCAIMLYSGSRGKIMPRSEFSESALLDFEGHRFRCPVGYESVLQREYGDWTQPPPESERAAKHGIDIFYR